ncbi:hypothetical protein RUND412_001808 [Rhizina undulata]
MPAERPNTDTDDKIPLTQSALVSNNTTYGIDDNYSLREFLTVNSTTDSLVVITRQAIREGRVQDGDSPEIPRR